MPLCTIHFVRSNIAPCVIYFVYIALCTIYYVCNSYTIATRAIWDLMPEPKGVWYNYFKAYYGNASALL